MTRAFKHVLQVSLIILIYKATTIATRFIYGYVSYKPIVKITNAPKGYLKTE